MLPCGRFSISDLKKHGLYWNVPASQLIFLTNSDHIRLHSKNRSYDTIRKLSEARKGTHSSEETRRKISDGNKGKKRTDETRKRISDAKKRYWESRRAVS